MKKGVKKKIGKKYFKQNNNSSTFTLKEISELDKIVANLIISKLIKYYTKEEISETFSFLKKEKIEYNPEIPKDLELALISLINKVGLNYISSKLFPHNEVEIKDATKIGTVISIKKYNKRGRPRKIKTENIIVNNRNVFCSNKSAIINIIYRERPFSSFYIMKVIKYIDNYVASLRCEDSACHSLANYKINEKELILLSPHTKKFEQHSYMFDSVKSKRNDYKKYMQNNLEALAIEVKPQKYKNLISRINNFKLIYSQEYNEKVENSKKINFEIKEHRIISQDIHIFNKQLNKEKILPDKENNINNNQIIEKNNIIKIEYSENTPEFSINSDNTENDYNKTKALFSNENNSVVKKKEIDNEEKDKDKDAISINQSLELTNQDINIINNVIKPSLTQNSIKFCNIYTNVIHANIEKNTNEQEKKENPDENKNNPEKKPEKHIFNLGKKSESKNNSQDYEISIYDDNFVDNDIEIINKELNQKSNSQNLSNRKSVSKREEIIEINDEEENNLSSTKIKSTKLIYENKDKNDFDSNKTFIRKKRGRKKKIITLNSEENTNMNEIEDDDIKIVSKENKFTIKFGEALSLDSEKTFDIYDKSQKSSLNSNINNYQIKPGMIFVIIKPNRMMDNQNEKGNNIILSNNLNQL